MAHITGGGLLENIPRILPAHCGVEISRQKIPERPIFDVLRKLGKLNDDHMYRTFNMGAGMVLIVSPESLPSIQYVLRDYPDFPLFEIGRVVNGNREVTLI
jgi:phosphoribosylformylglycinamidine cyclo-ligase